MTTLKPWTPIQDEDDLVDRCCEVSPQAAEYFAEELYWAEVEETAVVTPMWLAQRALALVFDELQQDFGIVMDGHREELLTSRADIEWMLALRAKLDPTQLAHRAQYNPELREELRSIATELTHPGDLVREVIEVLHKTYPLDIVVDKLILNQLRTTATPTFGILLRAALEDLRPDEPHQVPQANAEVIGAYLHWMDLHLEQIHTGIAKAIAVDPTLNRIYLAQESATFDQDLVAPKNLNELALWHQRKQLLKQAGQDEDQAPVPPVYLAHVESRRHHPDYYRIKHEYPTREDIVLMMMELTADGHSLEDAKEIILSIHGDLKPDPVATFLQTLVERMGGTP